MVACSKEEGAKMTTFLLPSRFFFPGVTLTKVPIHRDERGYLVPILDVHGEVSRAYVMHTLRGKARDVDVWHLHEKQHDRFFVLMGAVRFAFSDGVQVAGLYTNEYDGVLVDVAPGVYHCFYAGTDCLVMNAPDKPYDPADELRASFADLGVEVGW